MGEKEYAKVRVKVGDERGKREKLGATEIFPRSDILPNWHAFALASP